MKNFLYRIKKLPDKSGYLLILPFYIVFLYFWLTPAIQVIFDSFTSYLLFGKSEFVGFENYIRLFHDYYFIKSITNTMIYTIGTVFPTLILGFLIALLMNSGAVRTGFARTVLFLPHVMSMVAVSMLWLLIYDPSYGYLNHILESVGLSASKWLQSPDTALPSIILMSIWKGIGYNMIINLAGLQSIPGSYYEVALIEGANVFQKIRHITLPMMAPTTFFLFVTGIINSFNVFEQVNVLTAGGPADSTTTIVHQIYTNGFAYFQMGYASAESVVLLLIICMITVLNFIVAGKSSEIEMG